MMPGDVVADGAHVVHATDGADVLVVIVVLAELLEPGVEVADVRRAAGHAFSIEFEDETERGVGRRVLRTEIQDPAVRTLHMILEVLG